LQIEAGRLKAIAETIGFFAVVASVLFLAAEVRQANRIAIASTEIGIRNGYSEFNRAIHSGPDLAELMVMAREEEVDWSPAERLRVQMVITDLWNTWIGVDTACVNGLAQESTCGELLDDIRAFINYFPGTRPIWREGIDDYPSLADTQVMVTLRQVLNQE